jgi:hypothetical protein
LFAFFFSLSDSLSVVLLLAALPFTVLRAFASHQQLGEAIHVDRAASFFFFFLCAIGLPARALASRSTLAA